MCVYGYLHLCVSVRVAVCVCWGPHGQAFSSFICLLLLPASSVQLPPLSPTPGSWECSLKPSGPDVYTDPAWPPALGFLSPSGAEPCGVQELRLPGPTASRQLHAPIWCPSGAPTGPVPSVPVFHEFSSWCPELCPPEQPAGSDDSLQLMSSSGFKALITLKESLFPKWKRKVHTSRRAD